MEDILHGVCDTETIKLSYAIVDKYKENMVIMCWPMLVFFMVGYTIGEKKFIKDVEKRNYPLDLMVYKSWYDRKKINKKK